MTKRKFQIIAITFFMLLFYGNKANAQETCTEKLYKANLLYEKGQFKEAIAIAITCTQSSDNITEKWQAYYLLTLAYLADNQKSEARKTAEKMKELNPSYIPGLQDPTELKRLLKSVHIMPKVSLGLAANLGGNITFPHISGTYNAAYYQKKYTSKSSWQIGLLMGYQLNEIISLHLEAIASNKRYDISYSLEGKDITLNENLTYFDFPLFARFSSLPIKGIQLFADIGAYTGRLVGAESVFTIKDSINSSSSNKINSASRRKKWENGILFGGGLAFKLKQVNITLDVRYYLATFSNPNVTNPDSRYNFNNLVYSYYFLDDDYKLNNLAISLSLLYPLKYKVIKNKSKVNE